MNTAQNFSVTPEKAASSGFQDGELYANNFSSYLQVKKKNWEVNGRASLS